MSADLLARLIEAGTPAALIAEVAMLAAEAAGVERRVEQAVEAALRPKPGTLRMRKLRAARHEASPSVTCDASDAQVTENVTEPAPSPPPLSFPQTPKQTPPPHPHPEGKSTRTRGGAAWPCPDGVDPGHWADVMANRKSKRLANTPTALAGILRDIAKFADAEWPPGRIVQHAAERGWGAIFDPRQQGQRHGQRPHQHDRPSGWAPRPGMEGAEPASLDDDGFSFGARH